jgi:non-specific serine/threonine protein kinase
VLDGIAALVDNSLLRQAAGNVDEPRFTMLETIREYAWDRLVASGEADAMRDRHAAWCLALVESAWSDLYSASWPRVVEFLTRERDNLRAALAWLDTSGQSTAFVGLTGALGRFWHLTDEFREGRAWLERALEATPTAQTIGRTRSLCSAGYLAHCLGDDEAATRRLDEGAALARFLDEPWLAAGAILDLGIVEEDRGNYDAAEAHLSAAQTLFQHAGHSQGPLLATYHLAVVAYGRGDTLRAAALWESVIAEGRALGDPLTVNGSFEYLGLLASEQGDLHRAATSLRECLALTESGGLQARARVLAAIAVLGSVCNNREIATAAARLQGAVVAAQESTGYSPVLPERTVYERASARLRSLLGEAAYAREWERGASMGEEGISAAVTAVLDGADPNAAAPGRAATGGLTPREREVLCLMANGQTNQEIADVLFIGRRTVATHIEHIFAKLGARSRTEAARLAAQQGLC